MQGNMFEQYWSLGLVCIVVLAFLLRLVFRERLTLQASLSLLTFLFLISGLALLPGLTRWIAWHVGFSLASNFFFTITIGGLTILHVAALLTLSRAELRTVSLTQELALLREKVDRLSASSGRTEHIG